MGNILKKYWKWILAAIIAIVILAIVLRPCNPGNTHKAENKEVQKEAATVNKNEAVAKPILDSLNKEIAKRDSLIITEKTKQEITRNQLDEQKKIAFRLAQELKATKITDSPSFSIDTVDDSSIILSALNTAKCDSLANIVTLLSGTIDSYEKYSDTTNKLFAQQLAAKDAIIQQKTILYSGLRNSFDKIILDYNKLYPDYAKEVKKRKGARTLNRLLGIVALAGGVLYLTK